MCIARALASAALLAATLAGAGCGSSSTHEIVLGVYGSLTGGESTFGQSTKNGIELALDELKKQQQGKIGGRSIRLVVEDDQGRAEEAELADVGRQRKILDMVKTRGQVNVSDLVFELKSNSGQVRDGIYKLVGMGLFTGYVNWQEGTLSKPKLRAPRSLYGTLSPSLEVTSAQGQAMPTNLSVKIFMKNPLKPVCIFFYIAIAIYLLPLAHKLAMGFTPMETIMQCRIAFIFVCLSEAFLVCYHLKNILAWWIALFCYFLIYVSRVIVRHQPPDDRAMIAFVFVYVFVF